MLKLKSNSEQTEQEQHARQLLKEYEKIANSLHRFRRKHESTFEKYNELQNLLTSIEENLKVVAREIGSFEEEHLKVVVTKRNKTEYKGTVILKAMPELINVPGLVTVDKKLLFALVDTGIIDPSILKEAEIVTPLTSSVSIKQK